MTETNNRLFARLSALQDGQTRDRYFSMVWKPLIDRIRPRRNSRAVFVFGKQRSGTSMLMYAFHRHPQVLVYDEHRNNRAFEHYRIRSFPVINELVQQSSFPVVCFKPICDSHLITEFASHFPGAHFIWLYRDYRDVANSSLRKFGEATRAIKLICERKPGGGWLQEGITAQQQEVLSDLYRQSLSEFDLSCLVWLVRNQIVVDSGLLGRPNVSVVKYEALVTNPEDEMRWLFDRMGVPLHCSVGRRLTARSIGRNPAPPMNPVVQALCDDVTGRLDDEFRRIRHCHGAHRAETR